MTTAPPEPTGTVVDSRLGELDGAPESGTVTPPVSGEHLAVDTYLVVSPADGRFVPTMDPDAGDKRGQFVDQGQVIGFVAGIPVRSMFDGWCMEIVVPRGKRVTKGQRLAWLVRDAPEDIKRHLAANALRTKPRDGRAAR